MKRTAIALLLLGCGHSAAYTPAEIPVLGPIGIGSDVLLTSNTEQDYWPIWTEDGRGLLYSFVTPGHANHRCVGLLPPQGGTRTWEMCDDRATQRDSINGFTAYALGRDGRLLYVEPVSYTGQPTAPAETTLWLADSAAPFARTALLTFPSFIGPTGIDLLTDLRWTGPNTFIALGQGFTVYRHCRGCILKDSGFADVGAVLIGTIAANHATLRLVRGTDGATGYSLVDDGSAVIFTRRDELRLFKAPLGQGVIAPIATIPTPGTQLLGVSCVRAVCIVAAGEIFLSTDFVPGFIAGPAMTIGTLYSVPLAGGAIQLIQSSSRIFATPQISPLSSDVVVQSDGNWGHLQTLSQAKPSDLHLFRGVVP